MWPVWVLAHSTSSLSFGLHFFGIFYVQTWSIRQGLAIVWVGVAVRVGVGLMHWSISSSNPVFFFNGAPHSSIGTQHLVPSAAELRWQHLHRIAPSPVPCHHLIISGDWLASFVSNCYSCIMFAKSVARPSNAIQICQAPAASTWCHLADSIKCRSKESSAAGAEEEAAR